MKKISRFLMLAAMAVMLMAGSAMAAPFIEVTGLVNADYTSFFDNGDGTTTLNVEYLFRVDSADLGAEMDFLSLEFEADVFASVNSFNSGDWSVAPYTMLSGNLYEVSTAGTTVAAGDSLIISAEVTLFTDALTNASLWDEGQVWGQSWFAGDTLGGGDGGSTAPVPEPATLLLLGSGIIGLALYGRRKKTI